MQMIPIVSKQIACVQYDEESSKMIVQYHTGLTQIYDNVQLTDYEAILTSTNVYDSLVRMTKLPLHMNQTPT
ncbi:KTSC domain-containing protein [Paenibacillus sp. N1-5-1-14]|uniref:KTSC domain-containing protein n=1 Tax=Paenibacillus radicibacter TaxID=2972488 RepID=UPI002158B02F|nr:KTSC domain-containing protein [Paenibacillus radicibacter]MCR8644954.1 KTSC domain-containing protein [Paenibacillus radicibacter]